MDWNKEIFTNDEKRVIFVLSFLDKGKALSWADYFITTKRAEQGILTEDLSKSLDYGTWADFNAAFLEFFQSQDTNREALDELNIIQMEDTVKEHVIRFKTLVIKSGLKDERNIIIKFELSLPKYLRELINMGNEPKNLQAWYETAIETDRKFRRRKMAFDRNDTTQFKRDSTKARGTLPH